MSRQVTSPLCAASLGPGLGLCDRLRLPPTVQGLNTMGLGSLSPLLLGVRGPRLWKPAGGLGPARSGLQRPPELQLELPGSPGLGLEGEDQTALGRVTMTSAGSAGELGPRGLRVRRSLLISREGVLSWPWEWPGRDARRGETPGPGADRLGWRQSEGCLEEGAGPGL